MGGGRSKTLQHLAGQPVIERSVRPFLEKGVRCVVTAQAGDREEMEELFSPHATISVIEGGVTRGESVFRALSFITKEFSPQPTDIILVHDGARCLLSTDLLERVIERAQESGAAVPGVEVTDTLKTVNAERVIIGTVNRAHTIAVQTPQGFHYQLISKAYASGDINATDDAGLVERFSAVSWVEGERQNIKITRPGDLSLASFLLSLPQTADVS